jgi:hypothetical protein
LFLHKKVFYIPGEEKYPYARVEFEPLTSYLSLLAISLTQYIYLVWCYQPVLEPISALVVYSLDDLAKVATYRVAILVCVCLYIYIYIGYRRKIDVASYIT